MQPARALNRSLGNLGGNHTGPNTLVSTLVMYLSAEAISKPACLYVAALGVWFCSMPPQPTPSEELCKKFSDLSTAVDGENCPAEQPTITRSPTSPRFGYKEAIAKFGTSYFPYIFPTWVIFMSTIDTIHTIGLFPQIMPVGHAATALGFNTQLIVGLVLTIASSALRVAAFQTLGRFFTYQLSLLPDHKLVTHGLYSYVRHPSYAPVPFLYVGVVLTVTAPGSVLYDYLGVYSTIKLIIVLALGIVYGIHVVVCRAEVEDRVLRKAFGKEWDEWARKVPYKFIPGVF